ncbi:MAG: sulfatase-like hydrolase/transferase, partial [Armatimonadota bacterium]|nr:sulfatase-like hydrolase/transferase [Armatimonadota bacterium]
MAAWAPLHAAARATPRPNILWITAEDHGPQLGCYGDPYADTPHLDALAARGMRYLHAWSTAPVCAPARTAIICGMYPSSLGAEHMRSMVPAPAGTRLFPQFLREVGYYCTNNAKEDYNVRKPPGVWDASSPRAHWRNRAPAQPFFAVFNFTGTHESQIWNKGRGLKHDPARAPLPAYHPDLPETRADWAKYYDNVTAADARAGELLRELSDAGLADDTIVFYYADHGPGMPRCKRTACNSG